MWYWFRFGFFGSGFFSWAGLLLGSRAGLAAAMDSMETSISSGFSVTGAMSEGCSSQIAPRHAAAVPV